ncbi:hypothetical protein MNBD_GAMMA22-2260 [hydrothermal vent metagenome]|uniref:Uncharacterized protein n=1 Tax=hydrothermal vent metagenome TaxID=652676 RepID=A0A3B1ABL1_9ZZZZ
MKRVKYLNQCLFTGLIVVVMTMSNAIAALDSATLNSNIDNLITQGNSLLVNIKGTVLTSASVSSQLSNIESEVINYQNQVTSVYDSIVAETGSSLSLTDELLISFQTLSTVSSSIAIATIGLTVQLAEIASSTSTSSLDSSLTTLLRLSDDIGLMANRILEMANKILVMADNIGLMADRIIATQIIQSDNLKLIVDATLQTQTNTIEVIKLFL